MSPSHQNHGSSLEPLLLHNRPQQTTADHSRQLCEYGRLFLCSVPDLTKKNQRLSPNHPMHAAVRCSALCCTNITDWCGGNVADKSKCNANPTPPTATPHLTCQAFFPLSSSSSSNQTLPPHCYSIFDPRSMFYSTPGPMCSSTSLRRSFRSSRCKTHGRHKAHTRVYKSGHANKTGQFTNEVLVSFRGV